jgi:hypothetical protein
MREAESVQPGVHECLRASGREHSFPIATQEG